MTGVSYDPVVQQYFALVRNSLSVQFDQHYETSRIVLMDESTIGLTAMCVDAQDLVLRHFAVDRNTGRWFIATGRHNGYRLVTLAHAPVPFNETTSTSFTLDCGPDVSLFLDDFRNTTTSDITVVGEGCDETEISLFTPEHNTDTAVSDNYQETKKKRNMPESHVMESTQVFSTGGNASECIKNSQPLISNITEEDDGNQNITKRDTTNTEGFKSFLDSISYIYTGIYGNRFWNRFFSAGSIESGRVAYGDAAIDDDYISITSGGGLFSWGTYTKEYIN